MLAALTRIEHKTQQKRDRYGVRNTVKMTWNMGSGSKIESRHETYCKWKLLYCYVLDTIKTIWGGYMKDKLSKELTRFRKNYSIQHCLSCMLEIWKKVLDKGGYICAIFMDLSKAFDTLNHDLLIAKLGAYGFETDALRYMKSYLKNRK